MANNTAVAGRAPDPSKTSKDNNNDNSSPTLPAPPRPEWIRAKDVRAVFGIGKGKLYEWIHSGKVRHITLKEPGQAHATRLVSWASLTELLDSMAEGGAR